jgi:hypothetical protein
MKLSRVVKRLRQNFKGWIAAHAAGTRFATERESLRHLQLTSDYLMSVFHQLRVPRTPIERCAKKVFSQSDEDGITLEILRRIGLGGHTCLEIGCGNGLENNTLILLATGWKTIWIDGLELAFNPQINPEFLMHSKSFVTCENVVGIVNSLSANYSQQIEFISLDIDGNDGYIAETLLKNDFRPSVFVVEINEVFPPPIMFRQDYVETHVWDHSRNYGWSLQAFIELFNHYGYRLVGCNPQTGVNAFFVRGDHSEHFADIPLDPNELFVGRQIRPFKFRDQTLTFDAATIEKLILSLE